MPRGETVSFVLGTLLGLLPASMFKYGDSWQHHYVLGDKLNWGGNDVGEPGHKLVVVVGYETMSSMRPSVRWDLRLPRRAAVRRGRAMKPSDAVGSVKRRRRLSTRVLRDQM